AMSAKRGSSAATPKRAAIACMMRSALYHKACTYRIAVARRDVLVATAGVHPRKLRVRRARVQQSILLEVDVIACSLDVATNDPGQHRIELAVNQRFVVARFKIRSNRVKVPQRGIDGVVFRRSSRIGKAVGQHAAVNVAGELEKNAFGNIQSSGC